MCVCVCVYIYIHTHTHTHDNLHVTQVTHKDYVEMAAYIYNYGYYMHVYVFPLHREQSFSIRKTRRLIPYSRGGQQD